jgi:hypothetical protein
MSFQAYIDNIQAKTGKSPEDFKKLADQAGVIKKDMKAAEFTDWLKKEFGLGHGHCMALWALFISNGWIETSNSKMNARKTK